MRSQLEQNFFPFVIKPGRYAGGEPGQVRKNPANRLSFLYAYPDKYEIGMSYVGLQTLYHLVNTDDRFLCERVFAPDVDAERRLRELNLPLFSLESWRSAGSFDVIGFTLVDESVYTNVLAMLDMAGVPLRSSERTDEHPLIFAGGPAAYNPEPLAPFIDLFFIGDSEEGLPQMLGILHEMKGATRREKLERLVRNVESVYVPGFYDKSLRPLVDFAPEEIRARVIGELKPEYYPDQPLMPLIDTVHNHLGVEIMRGCPQGCRFCMAGSIYRPVRFRPWTDIISQVERQLGRTGYAEVTLLSLSSSDYPEIDKLATTLARSLERQNISLSLPSLRPGSITPALLDAISRVRKGGLTLAPEAGSERLRLFIRKDFPDEAILDTVKLALKRGWRTIKLYFMVGLPSETDEDLLGIGAIARAIRQTARRLDDKVNINIALSPFVPKPHTPFQWDEIVPEEEIYRRIAFVRKNARAPQVHFKHPDTRLSTLVGVLGRGDRKIGDVIEKAFRLGSRFDGWSEHFSYDNWLSAFETTGVSLPDRLKAIPFTVRLPWAHIRKGPSLDHLRSERQRTSVQLREYVPHTETEASENNVSVSYGRGKKKAVSRNIAAPTKNRLRIRWGRGKELRFMSHLDNLRMFERSLRRAGLPVAYSQGYNPTMKLSFGPPLTLGFTSEAEYLDVVLESNLLPYMVEALRETLPAGICLHEAKGALDRKNSLSSRLNRALYTLPVSYWKDPGELHEQTERFIRRDSAEIERVSKSGNKQVDIRPAVYAISMDNDRVLLELGIGEGGFARPAEVVRFLADGLIEPLEALVIHRCGLYYATPEGNRTDPMEL